MSSFSPSDFIAATDHCSCSGDPSHRTRRVLFYGDGNACGCLPDGDWLEQKDTYPHVACEACLGEPLVSGLPGRASVGRHPTLPPELRGAETFLGVLLKYTPVKGIVICLGTNDVLAPLNLSADRICTNIAYMVGDVRQFCGEVPTLVVSPPPVAESCVPALLATRGGKAATMTQNLAAPLEVLASKLGILFFDGSSVVPEMDASDGLHLSQEAHKRLGNGIAQKLVELIGEPPELPERPRTLRE